MRSRAIWTVGSLLAVVCSIPLAAFASTDARYIGMAILALTWAVLAAAYKEE